MSSIRSPSIKAIAYFVGISVHLLHLCLRMHPMHQTAECDCTWEHLSDEIDDAWINWVSVTLHNGILYLTIDRWASDA